MLPISNGCTVPSVVSSEITVAFAGFSTETMGYKSHNEFI